MLRLLSAQATGDRRFVEEGFREHRSLSAAWSGANHGESLYGLKIAVAANKRCIQGEGHRRDPKIVLIERKAAALLRSLQRGIAISGGGRDGLTWQDRE